MRRVWARHVLQARAPVAPVSAMTTSNKAWQPIPVASPVPRFRTRLLTAAFRRPVLLEDRFCWKTGLRPGDRFLWATGF
jgi:hypothetical protein